MKFDVLQVESLSFIHTQSCLKASYSERMLSPDIWTRYLKGTCGVGIYETVDSSEKISTLGFPTV